LPVASQICTSTYHVAQETILDLATPYLVNILWLELPRATSRLTKASPSSKWPRIEILLPVCPQVLFSGLMISLPTPDTCCMNCKKQGWKCTGRRITYIYGVTGSMKLCSRYGISFGDRGASFKHHEIRCRGRCTRCRGLDCEKIRGGGCQPHKQAKVSCTWWGHSQSRKNVAILSTQKHKNIS
jgi:hypothetical protein